MMVRFQIIVEGDADKKFFEDYYHHLFNEKAPKAKKAIQVAIRS